MKKHSPCLFALGLLCLVLGLPALAEVGTLDKISLKNTLTLEKGAALPSAEISDLAWLSGSWRGSGLDGDCEEIWSQPVGDRMFGLFSLSKAGAAVFSEAMMLVEEQGSLVLKIKHFGPDFVGWEEKDKFVSFELVKLGPDEAFFDGLTLRRSGEKLTIFVRIRSGEQVKEEPFFFERVKL